MRPQCSLHCVSHILLVSAVPTPGPTGGGLDRTRRAEGTELDVELVLGRGLGSGVRVDGWGSLGGV